MPYILEHLTALMSLYGPASSTPHGDRCTALLLAGITDEEHMHFDAPLC